EPDGPVTAMNSPRWTSRFTPRSARTSTSPTTYVLTRFLTPMTVEVAMPLSTPSGTASALRAEERISGRAGRGARRADAVHAGHELRAFLQLAVHEFRERAVRDAEAHRDRFQLAIDEQPHAPVRLLRRERLEQFLNGLVGLRLAIARLIDELAISGF